LFLLIFTSIAVTSLRMRNYRALSLLDAYTKCLAGDD